jgi:GNAT superfamily N-acetyltransferase
VSLSRTSLELRPLTKANWPDFVRLFGGNGACGGCWCMWWRQTRREFEERHGESNKRAMKRIVEGGEVPGLLAYEDGAPVAWCSIAPRERFPSLNRSRVLKPLDDETVWSLVCLFVERGRRGRGLTVEVIKGAVEYARANGCRIVEAYPSNPRGRKLEAVSSYMGVPAMFERSGFVECARPSKSRVIMRRTIR